MIKKCLLTLLFLVLLPGMAWAVPGTCVVTENYDTNEGVYIIRYVWVGDSTNGNVPATANSTAIAGYVIRVVTNPGSPAPTDNYDFTLLDGDTCDVLGGEAANRDTANTEQVFPKIGNVYAASYISNTTLTLTIDDASQLVLSAEGEVIVYVQGPRW